MAVADLEADEFRALRALSARIGADPALVQGAGGNTSLKTDGGTLWIKASGTWLMHAETQDIMVPVALEPLRRALGRNDPAAEKAQDFVDRARNPSDLRPSIETTVHAVLPQKVVVHVHCVETIAVAVRTDAVSLLEKRLSGLAWAFVPYVRPGLPLSRWMSERMSGDVTVVVLGNHGLVVAADSVDEAADLLADVSRRLTQPARPAPPPDIGTLQGLAAGSAYGLPADPAAHGAATDPLSARIAAGGSLYPDHVIFLGAGSVVARPGEAAEAVRARVAERGGTDPVSILVPGKGVLMHRDAGAGAQALARCLADVTARVPADAPLRYFTAEEDGELLNWDAEKYRQSLPQPGRAG
ncbi:MAG: class II aldolase/adducin family protein [Inquilinaceae bacterium]